MSETQTGKNKSIYTKKTYIEEGKVSFLFTPEAAKEVAEEIYKHAESGQPVSCDFYMNERTNKQTNQTFTSTNLIVRALKEKKPPASAFVPKPQTATTPEKVSGLKARLAASSKAVG
jgi:beta-xylosidase